MVRIDRLNVRGYLRDPVCDRRGRAGITRSTTFRSSIL
jgi:hypothetical protein